MDLLSKSWLYELNPFFLSILDKHLNPLQKRYLKRRHKSPTDVTERLINKIKDQLDAKAKKKAARPKRAI